MFNALSKTHNITIINVPYPSLNRIKEGKIKVLGKKYAPRYQLIKKGDILNLKCGELSYSVKVTRTTKYADIETFLKEEKLNNVFPGVESISDALEILYKWTPKEEIDSLKKKYKISFIAFAIEPLN